MSRLVSGSTNQIAYWPAVNGTPITAALAVAPTLAVTDSAGAAVTGFPSLAWSAGNGYLGTVAASAVPTSREWQTLTFDYSWASGGVSYYDQEPIEIVPSWASLAAMCSVQQVKDVAKIPSATTTDDERIGVLIDALTEACWKLYGREFVGHSTATRTFPVLDEREIDLAPYDLRSVTAMTIHPNTSASAVLVARTNYLLAPIGGDSRTGTYTYLHLGDAVDLTSDVSDAFGVAELEIAGAWGIWAGAATVPADVNLAAIEGVLFALGRGVTSSSAGSIAETLGEVRGGVPSAGKGWAVWAGKDWRLMRYARAQGIY